MSQSDNNAVQDISPEQTIGALGFQRTIRGMLTSLHTVNLVEIVAVSQDSDSTSVGTCTIRPLTLSTDASNNPHERGEIRNVPYFRFQGGKNAIICDPSVGDIGLALFCERDISRVKEKKGQAQTDTKRQHDMNDAVYLGGFLNGVPEQYVHFKKSGINIKSKGDVNINGLKISEDGKLTLVNGVIVDTHIHSQAPDSKGDTQQDTGKGHN